MGFTSRHPRYTISLIVGLFVTILLFANSSPAPGFLNRPYPLSLGRGRNGRRPPPSMFVKDQLKDSELHYQETIKQRRALITKFGPTANRIESFPDPSTGYFYTLWDFFTASFACPHRVQRVGTLGDGGKWVCGMEVIAQKEECVIYSVGVNGESSFEASLLENAPGCKVYGYDFSVNSFGPEIDQSPSLKERSHFRPYALGGSDAHGPSDNPKFYTLASLMKMNGHSFIDILKIDIEGAEFEALDALIDAYVRPSGETVLPFGQLQLEIHPRDDSGAYARFPRFLQWWEKLESAGLRPFWTEPNLVYINLVRGSKPDLAEYSFINTRGDHDIIREQF